MTRSAVPVAVRPRPAAPAAPLLTGRRIGLVAGLLVGVLAGCAGAPPPTGEAPRVPIGPAPAPALLPLPPVDPVRGAALAITVRYPAQNAVVATRDSNFVLGAIGSGDATLTIDGAPVAVAPNGAFIAWVANPAAAAPAYELVAARGADTVRRTWRIRLPSRAALPQSGARLVDSASVAPGPVRARGDELIRVSVRVAGNASAWFQTADGARRPMPPLNPAATPTSDAGVTVATDVPARLLTAAARITVARGADTTRLAVPAAEIVDPESRVMVSLRTGITAGSDTDRTVNARTIPDGTYKWLLLPGTILEATGRASGFTRVRFDESLEAWVANDDVVALPAGTALPRRVTSGFRVTPSAGWVDLAIATGERPAFIVEPGVNDDRTLVLTLYGVQANPEISPILGNDSLVRRIGWEQVSTNRVRVTLQLTRPVFGWLSLWDAPRGQFVLRVRRPPTIADVARPLAGLTIAIDPGHPPAGATGPTGLYEGDAVLPVGRLVRELLAERGANVVLTRTTRDALDLTERAVISRRANAHAFVSIHLNAFGDGVNPFVNDGTSTLFFHQHSEALARLVQRQLRPRLGLRDLGVHYQNLAVARPSWYPAVLTEGAFVIMPEQEAAMRNPIYLRRYADGIVAGLEDYFRELARK